MKKEIKKIVLAYSGGLDTSAIIPWLKENYNCEVIAFVADVGQESTELNGIEDKAINSGASFCYIEDLKEEMVKDYIYPSLKTGAIYEGKYLLGTSIARPIIAKALVKYALSIGADALCHGCTGKGNDQVRFESAFAALAPQLHVIAPWREWDLHSREDLLNYLAKRNIPCTASLEKIYSRDANAWHVSTEGGVLENTWNQSNDLCWVWTKDPESAPDKAENISILVKNGEIIAVDGKHMNPYNILNYLNEKGVEHGIGRIDIVENRLVGIKSRGCYETPGGTIMMEALRAVEQLVLDKESFEFRQTLGLKASHLIYDGRWFTPLCQSLLSAANELAKLVNGEVIVKLYKGQATVIQKRSENSLYSEKFATFGEDDVYDHSHAGGFIRLYSLASRIRALNLHYNQ
ncbi:argininosuccinate synthase [Photobacterium phosphoreum]|uniref:argininosuccinate synthase n=1 Tax=Photobacterium phosphoreum TaxID=659 RepID=UPI0007F9594A|nr:argininosuccinate synthase [Photobacterium phosphoreum]OBU42132.1 argininosuccinate synthase [Photobacterium phosphoreum]